MKAILTELTCGVAMLALAGTAKAAGPTSTLYLTSAPGSSQYVYGNYRVLGGTTTAIASPQNSPNESAIAAYGGSLFTAQISSFGNGGSVYDANFNYVSSLSSSTTGSGAAIYDGTSDGNFNYGIDFNSGYIYRFSSTWGGTPAVLFQAAGLNPIGITYDSANNSFWTSDFNDGIISDYSMNGVLLSSFNNGYSAGMALAYDPADNTLWMLTQWLSGNFVQYDTSGTLLQTMVLNVPSSDILGAEFMTIPVPEPSLLALAGLGGLSALALSRGRK